MFNASGTSRRPVNKLPFRAKQLANTQPPDPGEYLFKIVSANVTVSGKGEDRLQVDFEITEGEREGATIRQSLSLAPGQSDPLGQLYRASGVLDDIVEDEEVYAEFLLNRRVRAQLSYDEGGDGRLWPRLFDFERHE